MIMNEASRLEVGIQYLISIVGWQENPYVWVVGHEGRHQVLEGRSHSMVPSELPGNY